MLLLLERRSKLRLAVRPRKRSGVFRYRLHSPGGDDLGEATYAMMMKPGEEILVGNGRRFRVLDVVSFEEQDESPFVGLLLVRGCLAVQRDAAGVGLKHHSGTADPS